MQIEANPMHATATEGPARPAASTRRTVLVIDDDEHTRLLVRTILRREGFGVVTECNGLRGVSTYEDAAGSIDVVIVDMAMPDMDGRATVEALRAVDANVRILVSSGLDAEPGLRDAGALPSAFLPKPYHPSDLVEAVRSLIAD